VLGFLQILVNEFEVFLGAFTGGSPPAGRAMENREGALAGIAAVAISPMERWPLIAAGRDPARGKFSRF
jgi:hypothetical protein